MKTEPKNKPQNKQELINLVINRERRNSDIVLPENKYNEMLAKSKPIRKIDVIAKVNRIQRLIESLQYDTN